MIAHNPHFHPSPSQRIYYGMTAIFGRVFVAIYRFKGKAHLRTGMVRIFNRSLQGIYRRTLILQRDARSASPAVAKRVYPVIKKMLFNFSQLYASLEKVSFFTNPTTRKLADEIYSNYFEVERDFRYKAFQDNPVDKNDTELTVFAETLSLHSLHETHAL